MASKFDPGYAKKTEPSEIREFLAKVGLIPKIASQTKMQILA